MIANIFSTSVDCVLTLLMVFSKRNEVPIPAIT